MSAVADGRDTDAAKAEALLATMGASGGQVLALEQLEGGWSRHSYAATVDRGDGVPYEVIVRARPRATTLDTDLGQEYRTFALLQDTDLPTPDVHGFEPSEDSPYGGPFFVMERLPGHAINVWRGKDRRLLQEDWDGERGIAEDFARDLAGIHAVDLAKASEAAVVRGFQETIDHWYGVYSASRLVADPVVEEAYAWVREREPDPVAPALVHGDYRIGNCLVDRGHVSAILDWELSFVGDPRFDLGYMALDYHAGKFTKPGSPLLCATADTAWFHERYEHHSGRPVDPEVVRTFTVLGGLMLFAIMTTGLGVYARGETTDIRMAWTRFVLPGLRQDLAGLMAW